MGLRPILNSLHVLMGVNLVIWDG